MAEEYKELCCRDVGADCDFTARGKTVEEIIELCADHVTKEHGVTSFPQDWYLKMRSKIQTITG